MKFYTITEKVKVTLENFACGTGGAVYADIRVRNAVAMKRVRVYSNGAGLGFDRERVPNKAIQKAIIQLALKGIFQRRMRSLSLLGVSPGSDRTKRTVRKCPEFSVIVELTR